ncbi:MAG: ribonuclease Z [Chitinophagales bacterium]|nr:ribonuclease Z [Chitinophagales bacterium]
MTFEVTILGSNSALPAHGRHPTAQVLNHNEKLFLLDCGEGTQIQLSSYHIRRSKINHIFISHLHGDHYYGLIGLLTSYHLLRRTEPLHLFCPKGLSDILQLNFKYSDTRLIYELIVHEIESSVHQLIYENEHITVHTIPMRHRIPCCGFLFREKKRDRRILPEKLEAFGIPVADIHALKEGKDLVIDGKLIPNSALTTDPPAVRSYAFCSDTLYTEELTSQIKGADLLYHEATFMEESSERAALTYHSTTLQAAAIARKAAVKKLMIGHFSAKYEDLNLVLREAQTVFADTMLAVEGSTVRIGDGIQQ